MLVMKEIFLLTNSEERIDIIASGLTDFFICPFCLYWEPPGLPFLLMAVYILFLLT